jgi:FixJ family two-component response regulator
VLELIAAGLLNKQAAGELGITELKIKAHRASIMRKM